MPDIWSGIGTEISRSHAGEWLYQVGGEVRGPVPMQVLAQKLISGEVDLKVYVAREGGEFHPISRVAAFATHITEAKKQAHKRALAKMRRILMIAALPALILVSVAGYFVYQELGRRRAEVARQAKAKQEEIDRKRKRAEALPDLGLVALVSFGSEDTVKIKKNKPTRRRSSTSRKTTAARQEPDEVVQQCRLSQGDVLGTLKKHLGKINVCVEDERSRDKQNLLPSSLELEFVVQTSGRVTEFRVGDRHYRTGPLNNCLVKAFNTIKFPESTGANCPISIPIRIKK